MADEARLLSVNVLRRLLRNKQTVIYDRFVDTFSEPPNEPPIRMAQINRPSNGGFFVPAVCVGKRSPE
ncbi:hypothetical protein ACJ6X8_27900 [Pseudomonas alvandae]|uniref:hypothetical protein n=1 Tax=Pseudomonas TaxID=286 RepID=UPI00389AFC74